jgi:hypothetical protein
MSLKIPRQITAGAWSGLAAPAVAGTAGHYTAPWYFAVPLVVVGLGLNFWRQRQRQRRRRGGGGPSGRGPSGGS